MFRVGELHSLLMFTTDTGSVLCGKNNPLVDTKMSVTWNHYRATCREGGSPILYSERGPGQISGEEAQVGINKRRRKTVRRLTTQLLF